MEGTTSTPDIQSILSTLARFTNPVQPTTSLERISNPDFVPLEPNGTPPTSDQLQDPRLRPQSRSTASPKPIDPATITTWQDGLRCVTKIAAQNAQFAVGIRKMIEDQRKHEMRWYSERQALKQTQAKRASSSAHAKSILQSLAGSAGKTSADAGAVVDNEAELAAFDRKIYTAQQDLETVMTSELKNLGVPFFGTDSGLVVGSESELPEDNLAKRAKWSPIVTEAQLLELRRRMVGHLEDLYKD